MGGLGFGGLGFRGLGIKGFRGLGKNLGFRVQGFMALVLQGFEGVRNEAMVSYRVLGVQALQHIYSGLVASRFNCDTGLGWFN